MPAAHAGKFPSIKDRLAFAEAVATTGNSKVICIPALAVTDVEGTTKELLAKQYINSPDAPRRKVSVNRLSIAKVDLLSKLNAAKGWLEGTVKKAGSAVSGIGEDSSVIAASESEDDTTAISFAAPSSETSESELMNNPGVNSIFVTTTPPNIPPANEMYDTPPTPLRRRPSRIFSLMESSTEITVVFDVRVTDQKKAVMVKKGIQNIAAEAKSKFDIHASDLGNIVVSQKDRICSNADVEFNRHALAMDPEEIVAVEQDIEDFDADVESKLDAQDLDVKDAFVVQQGLKDIVSDIESNHIAIIKETTELTPTTEPTDIVVEENFRNDVADTQPNEILIPNVIADETEDFDAVIMGTKDVPPNYRVLADITDIKTVRLIKTSTVNLGQKKVSRNALGEKSNKSLAIKSENSHYKKPAPLSAAYGKENSISDVKNSHKKITGELIDNNSRKALGDATNKSSGLLVEVGRCGTIVRNICRSQEISSSIKKTDYVKNFDAKAEKMHEAEDFSDLQWMSSQF